MGRSAACSERGATSACEVRRLAFALATVLEAQCWSLSMDHERLLAGEDALRCISIQLSTAPIPEGRSRARSQAAQSSHPTALVADVVAAGRLAVVAGDVLGLAEEAVIVFGAR